MNASPLPANENSLPIRLELVVTDAEVTRELSLRPEGRDRDEYARQALRLGVLALRQAAGALDAQTITREAILEAEAGDPPRSTVVELLDVWLSQNEGPGPLTGPLLRRPAIVESLRKPLEIPF
jgi:hypothetical protein